MRVSPLVLLVLIVCLPLCGLAWLGLRVARDDEAALQRRFEDIYIGQLRDIDLVISRQFEAIGREMRLAIAELDDNTESIRAVVRNHPQVRQIIELDPSGTVLHPDTTAPLNQGERDFLIEARQMIRDRDLIRAAFRASEVGVQQRQSQSLRIQKPVMKGKLSANYAMPVSSDEGWYVWYWGRGIHLIFWQRTSEGHVVGALVERGRWLADLITALPETVNAETDDERAKSTSRFRLVDSMGNPVYVWGRFDPPENAEPLAELAVSAPLNSWRLQALVPEELLAGANRGASFQLASGIGAAAIALTVLAVFFWREYSREVRLASQRVSFVNQVSHELKTPLTNIRMYADLLEGDLEGLDQAGDSRTGDRLRVIVTESQRLSRLITNVLTFGRQQKQTLSLHARKGSIDEVVQRTVEQFKPNLERLGIDCELQLDADAEVRVDADAVEQILVNLISNVEKYAVDGKRLRIETKLESKLARITVSDGGAGIPASLRESIFEPFVRASSRLEDVTGTGIGLSIARDLARLHGGDITLAESPQGACFLVELRIQEEETAT